MTRIALCFPGQGSQVPGMATELMDAGGAGLLLATAAAEGLDLTTALSGEASTLRATDVAQPALLFVESVLTTLLEHGDEVVGVAGHSVGEYAALVAAGVLAADDAMRLVVARGRAMAAMVDGGMVALLGADAETADRICATVVTQNPAHVLVIANYNAPGQVVLSGSVDAISAAADAARDAGVRRVLPLNVSGAFHSPLMHEAAVQFNQHLDRTPFSDARIPVVCNVDAAPEQDATALRERLRRQLESPVRWTECVTTLVDRLGAEVLVEVGPGAVLSGLAKRITSSAMTLNVDNPGAAASLGAHLGAQARG